MRQLSGFIEQNGSQSPPRACSTRYPLSDQANRGRFAMFGRYTVESHLCREFQNRNKITVSHRPRRRASTLADFSRKQPNLMEFRTGAQLYTSVNEYLNWRSGASWRPLAHRFHDERLGYLSAANTLNQAFNSLSPERCACPYCKGSPFVEDRRGTAAPSFTPQSQRPAGRRARA